MNNLQEMKSFSLSVNDALKLSSDNLNRKNIMIVHMWMMQHIKDIMHKLMLHFTCTSDIWSSKSMISFMALTICFPKDDFNMKSFTLEVEQIEGKHTGDFVRDCMEKAFER